MNFAVRNWFVGLLAVIGCAGVCGCRPESSIPKQISVRPAEWESIRKGFSAEGGSGEATAAAARPEPTGFATLTGSFSFAPGDIAKIPEAKPLAISGDDAAYCSREAKPMTQSIEVDRTTGALKNVVIFLADDLPNDEKWVHASAAPGNDQKVIFDQKGCVFLSHVMALQVSQPMEIHNSDGVGHNTKLDNTGTPFNQIIAAGGQVTYRHTKEERQPYSASCSIHPWMNAWILPRKNGYVAVSGPDGTFKIENLPTGVPLTFKVWQSHVKFVKKVNVNGTATEWPNKGFTLTFEPDQPQELKVVLDAAAFAG